MTRRTITTKLVAEMRAARAGGMLVRDIAAMFGVGLVTVSKYTSERAQHTIETHERNRWQRLKADPAAYRKYLDKRRDCARRLTAERRAEALNK